MVRWKHICLTIYWHNYPKKATFAAGGQQRTDSTHVLAAIRKLNRTECIGETMRKTLNDLATVAPEWLLEQVTLDWFDLYGPRFDSYHLPKTKTELADLQLRIGADGHHLLDAIYAPSAPSCLVTIYTVRPNHAAGLDTTILLPQWTAQMA